MNTYLFTTNIDIDKRHYKKGMEVPLAVLEEHRHLLIECQLIADHLPETAAQRRARRRLKAMGIHTDNVSQ
jgi:hypothetical protein